VNGEICIDASVAVKWIQEEADSELAQALCEDAIRSGTTLIAPLHLPAEVTSAVYRRVRLGHMSMEEAGERLRNFESIPVVGVSAPGLLLTSAEIALAFRWRLLYDAVYLALGELSDCDVWTADRPFYEAASPRYPRLKLLNDYPPIGAPDRLTAATLPTG
jgi:predicted nucleic acid-binding protein